VVGTIEPRKAHAQTLAAFDALWKEKVDVNIVIVGKLGWMVDKLIDALRSHPERNRRLFWLAGITDEYLERVYASSVCLIAASEGEGFGLPLIEAAQHGLPIIARDIPVFREVAGPHAYYFSGREPAALAAAVKYWLILNQTGSAPRSTEIGRSTWAESTNQLLEVITENRWMTSWVTDGVHRYFGTDERLGSGVGSQSGLQLLTTGKAGWLVYGPYLALPAGHYLIQVIGTLTRPGDPAAYAEVATSVGTVIHASSTVRMSEDGIIAKFELELAIAVTDLEIRVWVAADSEICVSRLEIIPETSLVRNPAVEFNADLASEAEAAASLDMR
jgi:hypothetical protein